MEFLQETILDDTLHRYPVPAVVLSVELFHVQLSQCPGDRPLPGRGQHCRPPNNSKSNTQILTHVDGLLLLAAGQPPDHDSDSPAGHPVQQGARPLYQLPVSWLLTPFDRGFRVLHSPSVCRPFG